ncbi:phosphopantetheine-binding protein [Micromonospora sp. R77]|uniref:phosphopantetheine-binding protein n=1 Tax=Micromonospora sp. R77 TaxID=2925836 RepID=UPI001F61156F|nr:phosphopantetheine-binding protein [Micromonospora sp. R77]MCI4066791.1 phosphopantetheine-binding protein [Micromonospora sp. R77]
MIAAITDVMAKEPFDDKADLQEQGMTSIEMVSLIVTLEDQLGVAIPDDLLDSANFGSIERIIATVRPLLPA